MSEIVQRTMDNIMFEATQFARSGKPMNVRGEQWKQYTEECVAAALAEEKLNPHQESVRGLTREQRLERKQLRLAAKAGMSLDKWLAIAKSLYKIDGNYDVVSIARGTEYERTFECGSDIEAREKIYQLMVYKEYDHFERDCNFTYIPEQFKGELT